MSLVLILVYFVVLCDCAKSSNLALTYDANNSTCTAACSACSTTDNTVPSGPIHDEKLLLEILNTTKANTNAIEKLTQQVNALASTSSFIKNTTITNSGTINDVLLLVEELINIHNESSDPTPAGLPTSCQDIKQRQPNSPSGYYLLTTEGSDGTQYVYCYMEELCGSSEGWTRLAYFDMSDSSESCPDGFRLYESGGARACGRPVTSGGSCVSVVHQSNNITYSEICGRVTGYQYYTPNAFDAEVRYRTNEQRNDIDFHYIDGVSITRGNPRKHIWTLAAGYAEFSNIPKDCCPCDLNNLSSFDIQTFIGKDYFCESGRKSGPADRLFTEDPLWDGKGCDAPEEQGCCKFHGLPWFHKSLTAVTNDHIELRVCCDQGTTDEDVPVSLYEVYVK